MSNNPFVFLIQALSLLLPCDRFADGIWTPQRTVSALTALPCAECCKAPIDELGGGAFLGLLDRLDYAPSEAYQPPQRYRHHTPINSAALSLLLPCDRFADGIWTPQRTVSALTALPCAECCKAPIEELGGGAFLGLLDRLDYAPSEAYQPPQRYRHHTPINSAALSLLRPCDRFADGIWTPQRTVSALTALPCAECCKAPIDELAGGAFLGLLD
ncbi:hypothetical protein MTO96_041152 [Rhipicephalus appendiculatus]